MIINENGRDNKPKEKGTKNAVKDTQAAKIHGDDRGQSKESEGIKDSTKGR